LLLLLLLPFPLFALLHKPATQRDSRALAYGRLVHQLMLLWECDASPAAQVKVGFWV
jgi:hypothetical protein